MTDKFIPFNPETAKNGDVLYAFCNPALSYIYVAPCIDRKDASVVFNPRDKSYGYNWNDSMTVKSPKKTVWVNVYEGGKSCGVCYASEEQAHAKMLYSVPYVGTYPLEIDDVS